MHNVKKAYRMYIEGYDYEDFVKSNLDKSLIVVILDEYNKYLSKRLRDSKRLIEFINKLNIEKFIKEYDVLKKISCSSLILKYASGKRLSNQELNFINDLYNIVKVEIETHNSANDIEYYEKEIKRIMSEMKVNIDCSKIELIVFKIIKPSFKEKKILKDILNNECYKRENNGIKTLSS